MSCDFSRCFSLAYNQQAQLSTIAQNFFLSSPFPVFLFCAAYDIRGLHNDLNIKANRWTSLHCHDLFMSRGSRMHTWHYFNFNVCCSRVLYKIWALSGYSIYTMKNEKGKKWATSQPSWEETALKENREVNIALFHLCVTESLVKVSAEIYTQQKGSHILIYTFTLMNSRTFCVF